DVVVALLVAARPLVDEPARLPCRHAARVPGAVLDHDALTGRRKPRSLVRVRLGDQLHPDGMLGGQRYTGKARDLGRVRRAVLLHRLIWPNGITESIAVVTRFELARIVRVRRPSPVAQVVDRANAAEISRVDRRLPTGVRRDPVRRNVL